jgi:divalent metal cation (Fe/Co/Zn/Cd) transporter
MAWNAAECVVALTAGFVAASIALVGFGFDSAIEVTSSVAVLWRLWRDHDEARREASERRAMQIIGACFLLLAVYVRYHAIGALEAAARQTRVCAYLSAILLVGLGLNAWLGYWWAACYSMDYENLLLTSRNAT